jgi:hypothetical protein
VHECSIFAHSPVNNDSLCLPACLGVFVQYAWWLYQVTTGGVYSTSPTYETGVLGIPFFQLPVAVPHATRLTVVMSSSLPGSGYPQSQVILWPANTAAITSWSSSISTPSSPSSFNLHLTFDCDPAGATYSACQTYLPLNFIDPVSAAGAGRGLCV